jgi:hypothetical protein
MVNSEGEASNFPSADNALSQNTPPEDKSDRKLPTVYDVQKALFERIRNYPGGIAGVWRAIDTRLKESNTPPANLRRNKTKIRRGAFRRQVDRLTEYKATNENMTFGIRGNILLLMDIFRILNIRDISDLIDYTPLKPNLEATVNCIDIKSDEIISKIDNLSEFIRISTARTPRLSKFQVRRDLEAVLQSLNEMVAPEPKTMENALLNVNMIINHYTNLFSPEAAFAVKINNILRNYRLYYYHDPLLYKYFEAFSNEPKSNYHDKNVLIKYSPLYAVYFFTIIHRKFLASFNVEKSRGVLFYHEAVTKEGAVIKDDAFDKLLGRKTIYEYIINHNGVLQKKLSSILQLLTTEAQYYVFTDKEQCYDLFKDTVNVFTDIYFNHNEINNNQLFHILDTINTLNDLFSLISLGEPNIIYISMSHLSKINDIIQRFEIIKDSIHKSIAR